MSTLTRISYVLSALALICLSTVNVIVYPTWTNLVLQALFSIIGLIGFCYATKLD